MDIELLIMGSQWLKDEWVSANAIQRVFNFHDGQCRANKVFSSNYTQQQLTCLFSCLSYPIENES